MRYLFRPQALQAPTSFLAVHVDAEHTVEAVASAAAAVSVITARRVLAQRGGPT